MLESGPLDWRFLKTGDRNEKAAVLKTAAHLVYYFDYNNLISIGDICSTIIPIICKIKIRGIPYTKYQCLVLWRKVYMPKIQPMLPPIIAMVKRVASGIRKALFLALSLSLYMT